MATTLKELMEQANAAVPRIAPAEAKDLIAKGNALVVDVRDAPEIEKSGMVTGAHHVSRGMLEFRADPGSPAEFRSDARRRLLAGDGRGIVDDRAVRTQFRQEGNHEVVEDRSARDRSE